MQRNPLTTQKETTGKRWWVDGFEGEFGDDYSWGKNDVQTHKDLKAFIAKVEEQAYRKGVEASLGALPEKRKRQVAGHIWNQKGCFTMYYQEQEEIDSANETLEEAKENIGKLLE